MRRCPDRPIVHLHDLEVVWPLHRWHYVSPALADEGLVMPMEPESAEGSTTASVDVAPTGARWRRGPAGARGGAHLSRGDDSRRSTAEERDAVVAWLEEAAPTIGMLNHLPEARALHVALV